MRIAGAPIIITGASGGIGRVVAADLAGAGARLVLMDLREEALSKLSSQLGDDKATVIPCDLADEADAERAFAIADSELGAAPMALVHLAGRIVSRPLVNLLARDQRRHPYSLWRDTLSANLDTAFLAGALAAERMVAERVRGALVLVTSVAARGNAGQSAYAASKAGVEALVRVWSKELGPLGIRGVGIAPGFLDTPATHEALGPAGTDHWARASNLRRLGRPEAIAAAIRHALENDFLTGTTISVDGGVSL